MPLSAPEYWLEWAKNYFRCQFTYVGELIHKETWSSASFGWAEGLQTINPPIYRLTTAVSDIDQTNINRDIRDGNWLSSKSDRFRTKNNGTSSGQIKILRPLFFLTNHEHHGFVCNDLDQVWLWWWLSTSSTWTLAPRLTPAQNQINIH